MFWRYRPSPLSWRYTLARPPVALHYMFLLHVNAVTVGAVHLASGLTSNTAVNWAQFEGWLLMR